jgi:hypothetical protein
VGPGFGHNFLSVKLINLGMFSLVLKFLDPDVLKVMLAMRRDDGLADSQPSARNLR